MAVLITLDDKVFEEQPGSAAVDASGSMSDEIIPAVRDFKEPPDGTASVPEEGEKRPAFQTDWRFWMIILTLAVGVLLVSIETTIVITSLPTIVEQLGLGESYIWVSNVFLLAT